MKISDFRILSGWIEKYKPGLSKSDSSWDNSYCARLVIVSLAVNIGKLQSLVSEDLPIFKTNETFPNLTKYDLLKAGLYFTIRPDKIRKSEIFTTFEKIHYSFLNNLKSEATKSQAKLHPSYLANCYFYN